VNHLLEEFNVRHMEEREMEGKVHA